LIDRRYRAVPLLCALASCSSGEPGGNHVDVSVALEKGVPENVITTLLVTVQDDRHSATREFTRMGGIPLMFPTSFGIDLGSQIVGPVAIAVQGVDASHVVHGEGAIRSQMIAPDKPVSATLYLRCVGDCPGGGADGGVPLDGPAPDGGGDLPGTCGNGAVDPGESCDIAIPAGKAGACPPASCDDGIACTQDTRSGDGCTAQCFHRPITEFSGADGCCPTDATHFTDPDCSASCRDGKIDAGETCDTAIAEGDPGACPTAASCRDGDPCTTDILLSANTCSARCLHQPITAIAADGCCPAGASNHTDPDCPEVCGNGYVDPSETCDIGLPAGTKGACPPVCDVHGACFREVVDGTACRAVCRSVPVTDFINGDQCCPPGGNLTVDSDCPKVCGNGVVEPGEQCDRAIPEGKQGACPKDCGPAFACMPRKVEGSDCNAHCVATAITACSMVPDGCCPEGCTTASDPDCSATCGNGTVDPGETCDTAIADLAAGSCPKMCDDNNPCTDDTLLSAGTCNARCQFTPKSAFTGGDGCCPLGGNHNVDTDCPFVCGNGVVEAPKESCDPAIADPAPGACPTACPPANGCKQFVFTGTAGDCSARCDTQIINVCQSDDGCCPPDCNHDSDADCPAVCGNGIVDPDETCDRGITAGNPGACLASCDDNDPCTEDATRGRVEDCTRACSHALITACVDGDRCCPTGCSAASDRDCNPPVCGNGVVERTESCDPPSSCPTTCPDDGDPCTEEKLTGDALACNLRCEHRPITACSASAPDRCCPTGCSGKSDATSFDTDCPPPGP
jgi:hypothetical protein